MDITISSLGMKLHRRWLC